MTKWYLTHDAKLHSTYDTADEAYAGLLKAQSASTHHAIKYEGWRISLGMTEGCNCPPPPVSTGFWDDVSWAKYCTTECTCEEHTRLREAK